MDIPANWQVTPEEAGGIANTRWWQQFGDARLNELVEIALDENRDVKIATASLEEYMALAGIARSELYPQIGIDASANRSRTAGMDKPPVPPLTANQFSGSLNLSYEIDLWGRLRKQTEAARADLLAREEFKRFVLISVAAQVAQTYISLAELDARLTIARNALESRREALKLTELRFNGGLTSELDVWQAKSEVASAEILIPQLEQQIQTEEHLLSVLMGSNPGPILRGKGIYDLTPPPIPVGLPSDLLNRRPDIVQAEKELAAANARIGQARAEYFPRISLTGMLGSASAELANLFTGPATMWQAGTNAAAPLFNAGRTKRQVDAAKAREQQALFRYEKTVLTALREVNDSLVSHLKTREQKEAQARQVIILREAYRLANIRYMNGYTNYLVVLDAQRNLFNAELALIRLESEILMGMVDIYKSFGGGW